MRESRLLPLAFLVAACAVGPDGTWPPPGDGAPVVRTDRRDPVPEYEPPAVAAPAPATPLVARVPVRPRTDDVVRLDPAAPYDDRLPP